VTSLRMQTTERSTLFPDLGQRTLLMGILNVTPDSFSDGGRYCDVHRAVAHALEMQEQGADVIDVGAESTRPQAKPLSLDDEWSRLEPILDKLSQAVSVPLSIDTYKAEIARRAMACGVEVVNDVWGGTFDPAMNSVVAKSGAVYVIMHNGFGGPEVRGDIVAHVSQALVRQVEQAVAEGVDRARIWLDPGIGFGKTMRQNLDLVNRVSEIRALGYPVLIGTSRKSFIGNVLDLPVEERLEGTAASVAIAITRGADMVRVHDVLPIRRVARMVDATVRI